MRCDGFVLVLRTVKEFGLCWSTVCFYNKIALAGAFGTDMINELVEANV